MMTCPSGGLFPIDGKIMSRIADPLNGNILEEVKATVNGGIFFSHHRPLIYQNALIYRIQKA